MSDKTEMLRHFLASIAYHITKAIQGVSVHYQELDIGKGVRTPRQILHHITGVLTYAHSFYEHYETTHFSIQSWDSEVIQFYRVISKLDASIKSKKPREVLEEQILQGPLSDAMAHIGQLLMMRRLADDSVPSENFIYADIQKGVVGPDQPEPVAPDE